MSSRGFGGHFRKKKRNIGTKRKFCVRVAKRGGGLSTNKMDQMIHSLFSDSKKISLCISLWGGCVSYNLLRRTLPISLPLMLKKLNMTKQDAGILETILSFSFAIGKASGGIATDYLSPKWLFSIGLCIAACSNILFGLSNSLLFFSICWLINGYFQGGTGWPPATKLMTAFYNKQERGKWWSIVSTSQNAAGAIIAILGSALTSYLDWYWTFIIIGISCSCVAYTLFWSLPEIPHHHSSFPDPEEGIIHKAESTSQILLKYVLKNPRMWILSLVGLLQTFIRSALTTWTILFFIEEKSFPIITAGACFFWFDLGGMLGGILAGFISDHYFGGERVTVMIFFLTGLSLSFPSLYVNGTLYMWNSINVGSIGLFLYGPQVLLGLVAAEYAPKRATGTATGLVGSACGIGSTFAGYPLSLVMSSSGWRGFFQALIWANVLSIVLLLLLKRFQPTDQTTKESTQPSSKSQDHKEFSFSRLFHL